MFKYFGLTLRLLRELRGYRQAALARKAGIGKSQLSKYEAGRELPKLLTVGKLLDALGITFLDFANTLQWISSRQPTLGGQSPSLVLPVSHLLTPAVQVAFEDLLKEILRLHCAVMESSLPQFREHSPETAEI